MVVASVMVGPVPTIQVYLTAAPADDSQRAMDGSDAGDHDAEDRRLIARSNPGWRDLYATAHLD